MRIYKIIFLILFIFLSSFLISCNDNNNDDVPLKNTTYTVVFDSYGGSNIDSVTVKENEKVSKPVDPIRSGYIFNGWYLDNELYDFDSLVVSDIILTAKWELEDGGNEEKQKYTITFNSDGGSLVDDQIITEYEKIEKPNDPAKNECTFMGWYDGNVKWDFDIFVVSSNKTLVAKWKVNQYTISFETSGGSYIPSLEFECGESLENIIIRTPTHKYGEFLGWDQELPETMPANNITLTAIWEVLQPVIIFETNGGEKIEDMLLNIGDSVNVTDPFREGYTFNGWTPELPSVMPEEIIYVKANWIANSYSVTLDVNEGNELEESLLTVTYDSPYTLPTPTHSNFMLQFIGWYDGDELITDGIWKGLNSVTLTAKWIAGPKPYTENGKTYVNLGRYPQTVVTDSSIISNLNKITTTNSLGYIEYLGAEYKKVTAYTYSGGYTFIDGNSIINGSTYYFKVEPIKWRVLQESNGTYKLLCEYILDNLCYYTSTESRNVNGTTVYANNYMYSNVRAWLNGLDGSNYNVTNYTGKGFLDIAFTEEERYFINTTLVDNSASTTSSSSNSFACSNTNDKVYLLSYKDMFNTSFGFNSNASSHDKNRYATVTDYARSKGCYIVADTSSMSYGKGYWWLRSPYYDYYSDACGVSGGGYVYNYYVHYSLYGVRPALEITIQKSK